MAATRRELYLAVNGDVAGLTTAMKAGRTALLSLGGAATDVQAEVDRALAEIGKGAPSSAKALERSYTATFAEIRRNAKAVLTAPTAGAALQVLDAGAAEQAARAAEGQAVALRQVATAAAAVAQRAGEAGAAERVLAVAAAANAQQAEQEAIALRQQAGVLGAVRSELQANGVVQARTTAISGQAKAGYQQLSFQLGDVATQYASGTAASLIFAQQSGQVIQAISLISGESKGLIGLLGGPWGIAFSSALVFATPFVAKLFEGADALEKETDQLRENADKAAVADRAKQAFLLTEGGLSDAVRQLTADLRQQNDALLTNAERLNVRAKTALANGQRQQAEVGGELAAARAALAATPRSGGGAAPGAVSAEYRVAERKVAELEAKLGRINAAVASAEANRLATQADLADEAAKRRLDPAAIINRRYDGPDGLIAQAKKRASAEDVVNGALTRQLFTLRQQQKAEIDAAQARQREARRAGNDNQIGRVVDVAEATRIAASIGGRVTSGLRSAERQAQIYADKLAGRHIGPVAKPGTSDHERGQAIDIAYGPGISIGSIRAAFAKEGVAIRQLIDERTQRVFHVGFGPKGKSSETIARAAEAAEQKRLRDDEAYAGLKARAQQELLDTFRGQVTDIARSADLDVEAVRLQRERLDAAAQAGVAEKRWSQAKADELKLLNAGNATLKVLAIRRQETDEQAREQLQLTRDDLDGQNQLLSLQGSLAETTADRRRIALEILANEEKLARATLEAAIAAERNPARRGSLERQLANVGPSFELQREQAQRQTADPLESYGRSLLDATANLDDAFKSVRADGLHELEDGLVGVIAGTDSVAGAFKRMAASIIADLARIAIQKAIVGIVGKSFFGLADGGKISALPRFADGGIPFVDRGLIRGPGDGRSDSILALVDGHRPIRVSNGEAIVNARGVQKHWPLIDAINHDRLPTFATGGLVSSVALPKLPDVDRAAHDVGPAGRERMRLEGEIRISPTEEFDARMTSLSVRTVGAAAEPIMAGAQERTMKQLRRPSLPGGWG